MATRAQVAYIDEDMSEIITTYNHYDGYPDNLGKALLNHYDSDKKAYEIASSGYISYINPETGEVDATHNESPTIIRDGDVDTLLRKFYDHSNGSSADYVYLYAGQWIEAPMYPMTQDKFVAMMMEELEMTTPMYDEEEMMEEGYEAKWQKFLNEGEMDVVGVASSVLRDMPNLDVYIDSLKNDVRLNGAEDYYGYDSDDWEEDYNNYMADKMDM
jgi:hypothetical protein